MKRLPVHMLDPGSATDGQGPVYDATLGRVVWADPPAGSGGALPAGGATGQVLTKLSATDGDAGWATPTGGGGGGGGTGSGASVVFARGTSGASPLTISTTGVAAGDLCLFAIATRNSAANTLGPQGGGWTKIYHVDVGSDEICALWYKVAGASEPASWTWTHSAGTTSAAAAAVYRGPTSLVHGAFSGSGTTETKAVLGSDTGLQVCVWHGNYQGGGDLALSALDSPILTQDLYIKSSGNDQQLFIAHRDTYAKAATVPFTITGTLGNTQYKGAGVAVFD